MVGAECAACQARGAGAGTECTALTIAAHSSDGWTAITASGHRVALPRTVVDAWLVLLRPGQRLHARLDGGAVVEAWIA